MFEIKFTYRVPKCSMWYDTDAIGVEEQCFTEWAEDTGCPCYSCGSHEPNVIPFGDCVNAYYEYKHKGVSVKKYDVEPMDEVGYMQLEVGGKVYECTKIVIDNECIFDGEADE